MTDSRDGKKDRSKFWFDLIGATVGIAGLAIGITTFVIGRQQQSDAHQAEKDAHQAEKRAEKIAGAPPEITVSLSRLTTKNTHNGKWIEKVSGSGFIGDTKVYIVYPTLRTGPAGQPLPSSIATPTRDCPGGVKPVVINPSDGILKATSVPVSARLHGQYRIYVQGAQTGTQAGVQIFAPSSRPAPAPLAKPVICKPITSDS